MATPSNFTKQLQIKYLNKDFQSFKRDLIKFAQAHQSGAFQDFNETSPGMAILEFQAYVGDVLAFYLDNAFTEIKQDTAQQLDNVVAFAKSLGYKPAGKRASTVTQTFYVEVPATSLAGQIVPNDLYSPVMRAGAQNQGPNGVTFETVEDVFFSASLPTDPRQVTASQFDNNGNPTYFAIRKDTTMTAGKTVTDSFVLTDFQQFLTLQLSQPDVIEVLNVTDSEGNTWYEVDYLAQDTVFEYVPNTATDSDVVPYAMVLLPVPRRFITDMDPLSSKTSLIFGSGDGVSFDDQLVPNLADLALPLQGQPYFSSYAIDPQNFLKTRSLGLSPYDTVLTVTYRAGGGIVTNSPAGSINNVNSVELDFNVSDLDPGKQGAVVKSIETINVAQAQGGLDAETISEIKANSSAFFAAQNRVVTREDYMARILSLPAKFGAPEKVYVTQGSNNRSVNIHLLALDPNGHLTQATPTLTQNIATYLQLYRMLTDGVNILGTNIINLGVNFGIVCKPKADRNSVLAKALAVVSAYLATANMQPSTPISISDLSAQVQALDGVVSVYKMDIVNLANTNAQGLQYSSVTFDVAANTSNKILVCPENSIFEVKYPNNDIVGATK